MVKKCNSPHMCMYILGKYIFVALMQHEFPFISKSELPVVSIEILVDKFSTVNTVATTVSVYVVTLTSVSVVTTIKFCLHKHVVFI